MEIADQALPVTVPPVSKTVDLGQNAWPRRNRRQHLHGIVGLPPAEVMAVLTSAIDTE